ncbi:MAG TPA: tRNA (adenosine(37)-N6)-threonylcarbamoyltransferase complex ATPase subunit type 1 TsaE [Alphaproteobacteria bacterium]|nr:tRNA (adenosine(37)-N6)-threonylcarbamoyltransferase complex ATPase subunit type 1 TsaE [Alphaproteobacteria bacterium]
MKSPYLHPVYELKVKDEAALARLAALVARFAVVADVIRLEGPLGAGKTTFARAMLRALGWKGDVPSPTYTLVQTYETPRINVAHLDCYRLKTPAELEGLDIADYRKHGLIIAEWPNKGGALLSAKQPDFLSYHINNPDNGGVLTVQIKPGRGTARTVVLKGSSSWQHRFGLMFIDKAAGFGVVRRAVSEKARRAVLKKFKVPAGYKMQALPGDWSGRSYARITLKDGTSRMLMDSPPPWEGTADTFNVSTYYRSIGINAARCFAHDPREGYLLTEDFGNNKLITLVEKKAADSTYDIGDWYKAAVDVLVQMHKAKPMKTARKYAPRDWWAETARFIDWYFPLATGRAATFAERAQFMAMWQKLYTRVMEGPLGTMMWDFQSTNIMILGKEPKAGNIGLVDIQDARTAPVAQDLAILLRDDRRSYNKAEDEVIAHAAKRLGVKEKDLREWFEIASLQHCCRIIGGVARSVVRDGKVATAKHFISRRWEIAHQSFDVPAVKEVVAFIKGLEKPGIAELVKRKAG